MLWKKKKFRAKWTRLAVCFKINELIDSQYDLEKEVEIKPYLWNLCIFCFSLSEVQVEEEGEVMLSLCTCARLGSSASLRAVSGAFGSVGLLVGSVFFSSSSPLMLFVEMFLMLKERDRNLFVGYFEWDHQKQLTFFFGSWDGFVWFELIISPSLFIL